MQALTATATKRVRDDVKRILRLHDPLEVTGSVDRPNINLEVVDGNTMDEEEARTDPPACAMRCHGLHCMYAMACTMAMHQERIELHEWLCEHEGAGLIYCGRRQTCDELASVLDDAGVDAVAYHAGKDAATRSRLQRDFCGGDTRVMVATVPTIRWSARSGVQHGVHDAVHSAVHSV